MSSRSTIFAKIEAATSALKTKTPLPDYDVMAVYPRNRYVPERVRHFISHLKTIYSSKSYWKPV